MMGMKDLCAASLVKRFVAAFSALALAAGLLLTCAPQAVAATRDANGNYTYTVALHAGNGTIGGQGSLVLGPYGYGDTMNISMTHDADGNLYINGNLVQPEDDRYYVKGIRIAGQDESQNALLSAPVTQDQEYVISYGMKKDQAKYTVQYMDANGNQLMEPKEFYGNVGDKPVAAYEYIEGYLPNAYNITGTLQADASKNVFTFIYTPVDANGTIIVTERGGAQDSTLTTGPSLAMRDGQDAEGAAGTEGTDGAAAEAGAPAEPVELIDIDDEQTPLAAAPEPDLSGSPAPAHEDMNAFPMAGVLAGCLIGAALIIALVVVLVMRKRKTSN